MNKENEPDVIQRAVAKGTIGAFTVLMGLFFVFWGLGVMQLNNGRALGTFVVLLGVAIGLFGLSRIWTMLPKP
jgi:hypothetical protein